MGLMGTFNDLSKSVTIASQAMADMAPKITTVADASKKLADAQKQLAADTQFAKEQAAAHARAMGDDAAAMQKAADAAANLRSKLEAASEAQTQSATTTQAGIQVSGQATIIQLQAVAATQEQTDALVALLKAQNAYTDAVANTLGIAKSWNDYLAVLVSSYQHGSTSLIAYKRALEDFATGLAQQFAGATGKAKDALESMIQTIQKLINTAGAGPISTDMSYTGQLNQAFNTPGAKP